MFHRNLFFARLDEGLHAPILLYIIYVLTLSFEENYSVETNRKIDKYLKKTISLVHQSFESPCIQVLQAIILLACHCGMVRYGSGALSMYLSVAKRMFLLFSNIISTDFIDQMCELHK